MILVMLVAVVELKVINFALTLKAPITTAADDIHIFFHCFSEKIRLDVSCESSASQKNQAFSSSKDRSKKLKCRLLHFLFGILSVKRFMYRKKQ